MNFKAKFTIKPWEEIYELAKKNYLHYGYFNIPLTFKTTNGIDYDENGQKLGAWIQDQREKYKNGKLSNKRYNMLLKIGMRFEATYHDDHWDELYLLAEKYYEHYGNLEIPFHFKTTNGVDFDEDGVKLGRWISEQRSKYKKKNISEEIQK